MDDNHVLSTWNDLCAKVPEEKLQKVMGAGKGNSLSWFHLLVYPSMEVLGHPQLEPALLKNFWNSNGLHLSCIYISKIYENFSQLGWSQWVIKDFCFSQGRQRSWRLAAVHQGGWSGSGGSWNRKPDETVENSNKWQDMMRRDNKFINSNKRKIMSPS